MALHDAERWLKRRIRVLRGLDILVKPTVSVETLDLGSDYGGWTICPVGIDSDSIVYSLGVGFDVSFDLELSRRFGLIVHAFDPTPHVIEWVKTQDLPDTFVFHEYGIADKDGGVEFYLADGPATLDSHSVVSGPGRKSESITVPMKRLETAMHELGHDQIDILKMDIEGSEWTVLPDMVRNGLPVSQLLIEFHHLEFRSVGPQATRECIAALKGAGFELFSVSKKGQEYSFVHKERLAGRKQ